MRKALLVSSLLIFSTSISAQTRDVIVTVADLEAVCRPALEFADKATQERSPDEAIQIIRCFGYVEGVISAVIRLSVAGFMTDPLYEGTFCFPESTEPQDWIGSFVAWSDANPDRAETPAVDGFLLALIGDYPCDADNGSASSSPGS